MGWLTHRQPNKVRNVYRVGDGLLTNCGKRVGNSSARRSYCDIADDTGGESTAEIGGFDANRKELSGGGR